MPGKSCTVPPPTAHILFDTASRKCRSWLTTTNVPLYCFRASINTWIDWISRWLVCSSSIGKLAGEWSVRGYFSRVWVADEISDVDHKDTTTMKRKLRRG